MTNIHRKSIDCKQIKGKYFFTNKFFLLPLKNGEKTRGKKGIKEGRQKQERNRLGKRERKNQGGEAREKERTLKNR